jgi:hypothetical protein
MDGNAWMSPGAGTSFAAAHVSGAAALISDSIGLGIPEKRSWIAVRNLLLSGGTEVGGNPRKTISGRRLRLASSDGTGALTCHDQRVRGWLSPRAEPKKVGLRELLRLTVVNINCREPGSSSVLVSSCDDSPKSVSIPPLRDSGIAPDRTAGDGIFSVEAHFPEAGTYRLCLPREWAVEDRVTVSVGP